MKRARAYFRNSHRNLFLRISNTQYHACSTSSPSLPRSACTLTLYRMTLSHLCDDVIIAQLLFSHLFAVLRLFYPTASGSLVFSRRDVATQLLFFNPPLMVMLIFPTLSIKYA